MIGLATPYLTNNFGTKLQAFALQSAVRALGHEAEIIGYTFGESGSRLRKMLAPQIWRYKFEKRRKEKILRRYPEILRGYAVRERAFERFTREKLCISDTCTTLQTAREQARKYSAVVCGSDQIWLPSHIIADYYTLRFVPADAVRVAYAPSFGLGRVPLLLKRDYAAFLKRMDRISVRESAGQAFVRDLIHREVPVVLDPTLLLDKSEWSRNLAGVRCPSEGKFILGYFLGKNGAHREKVRALKKKTGFKIVALPHIDGVAGADASYADELLYDAGPAEFVSLIQNAEYVCTDSFHGSVFSLIQQKEFFIFERFSATEKGSTNSRIYSLTEMLGLEGRLLDNETGIRKDWGELLRQTIDYCRVNAGLAAQRAKSMDYLKKALE